MMEQVDRSGQEDFIWAMRTRIGGGQDDDVSISWRDRLYSKSSSLETSFSVERSEESLSVVQTRILASMVPDEIILDPEDYNPRKFFACALYGHLTGLEDLYQIYSTTKSGGSSYLTQIINCYLGAMIQEILLFCGDVIQLNGDNIMAIWKAGINNLSISDCVHQAIDCALTIQKTCGSFETDVGITLKTKFVIVSGELIFKMLGDENRSYWVLFGTPIVDIPSIEAPINGGEVAIARVACDYVNMAEYIYELLDEKNYARVFGTSPSWRSSQRNFERDDYADINLISPSGDMGEQSTPIEFLDLRPSIAAAVKIDMKDDLKKFMHPTIIRGIEMEEPVEYFTEMRNIVVTYIEVFIESLDDDMYMKVVEFCHQKIENIVTDMDGTISRVSLCNKNAQFLIIFGLRGFRHILESRRALACAMSCYKSLQNIDLVISTSASVTTGMTYCGAIGHMLRRDYTVMSLGVNNANLLLKAYPNKITCDKDTFLQSKLDPIQFILQEADVNIKTGPIYQYVEFSNASMPTHAITQYPLLDRTKELATYMNMLERSISNQKKSTKTTDRLAPEALVVQGRPKEGKTRLTEEFLFNTPNDVPMFRIKLIPADKSSPYQAIYFLFCVPLGIKEYTTPSDRQAKLISRLKDYQYPKLFCMLNLVFKVNFEKSSVYTSLTEPQKFYALNKIIKLLCYACFTILWVIIIDGGEHMDDESWSLIKAIVDTGRVFLVITLTNSFMLSPIAELVLKSKNIRIIELYPIDKWYHVGLACQFLNVTGIPAELEKVLHTKSNGNPGWIESFLITLVHSGALKIKKVPQKSVKDYGLVFSPTEMITRLSQCSLTVSYKLERHSSKVYFDLLDKWKIYEHSFNDSATNLKQNWSEEKSMHSSESSDESKDELEESKEYLHTTNICIIGNLTTLYNTDGESSINSIVEKVLDCLTSYEQLLLKASSVIGETLSRDMLHYIMNISDIRKASLAVERLFQVGVLGCAHGKFSFFGSNAILNPPIISETADVECKCEGLKIPEACADLERYASCGYLYFKIESFRDMTYNLLTVTQKKDFHFRAIRYLEKKTRKCIKCGGGFFHKIMGTEYNEVDKKKKVVVSLGSYNSQYDRKSIRKSVYDAAGSQTTFKSKDTSIEDSIKDTSAMKYFHEAVRSFSSNDFLNCECPRILYSMYKQLVSHCEAIGLMEKWLFSNMEFGRLCIDTFNIPLALKILTNSQNLFEEHHNSIVRLGESWRVPFIKARILTLIAKARLEIGQVQTSFNLFQDALRLLSFTSPKVKSIKYKITYFQHHMYLMHNKRYGLKSRQNYSAEYCDNVADCLNILCSLFLDLEMYTQAEVTAVCSLKKVLQSEKDFVILVTAFTNIISVYLIKRKFKYLSPLELKALMYCQVYSTALDIKDFEAIAYLYKVIFKSRVLQCKLDDAIVIGNLLIKMSISLSKVMTNFNIYPVLIQILILRNRVNDAIAILSMVEQSSLNDLDYYDLTWYYALCVCFHLDTGYTVIDFDECKNYRFVESRSLSAVKEPTAQKRYYVVIWLWLLRNGKFEEADMWEAKINKTWSLSKYESTMNLFTGLYYLEGLILTIVFKMDKMNNLDLQQHYNHIDGLFAQLHAHAQYAKMLEPRLFHLKAFYLLTLQQDSEAYSVLNKARKIAIDTGNMYDENWINHSELAWKQDMSAIDYNFWRDHATSDCLSFHLLENNDKLGFFTLEPPLYT